MIAELVSGVLDKAQTADFWRGVVYAASGAGIVFSPEYTNLIITAALGFSGLLHMIWHKKVENAKRK